MPRALKAYDDLSPRSQGRLSGGIVTIYGHQEGGERDRAIKIDMDAHQYRTYQYWQSRGKEETARVFALAEVYNRPAMVGANWTDPLSVEWDYPYDDYDDDEYDFDMGSGYLHH